MKRIEPSSLKDLIQFLRQDGYTVIAPTVRDSAIVYDEISSSDELPKGWTDEQANASYKLRHDENENYFQFTVGPTSAKRFLFPPILKLFRTRRKEADLILDPADEQGLRYAFLGIRPCDVGAIARQDQVFLNGPYPDPVYRTLRTEACIITVNCSRPGGTCFCASMGTGPRAKVGFDLALTEVVSNGDWYFLAEEGSDRGVRILGALPGRPATDGEIADGEKTCTEAASAMGRSLNTEGLKELLYGQLSDQHWDAIGTRCLTCANCTMVCPTCFCSTVDDSTDLSGSQAERERRWDSCFTLDFSYIHGGSVRSTAGTRYRQWMTHKLASWVDQFGTFGCVGCGRCITWCPVGIDLTEEAQILLTRAEARRQTQSS